MSTPVLHLKQFGKYEIIRKLGRSMSDVYLALDPGEDRRVILKIVEQSRDALTQTIVEAERRGAGIQQQLHSVDGRILEVYEFGEQDGCFFVAMQYAEGKSLAEVLRRETRLEPERAARYAAEVCSQLRTLHSFETEIDGQKRAVVHGDIKPSNIQIGPRDEVWLLDFGIAKAITMTRNLTWHNLGSPGYCSPERLRRAQVDPHADLWAVGVSLYEMVAGLPPYQAQSTRKLENLIQSRRPPRALPASCPPGLRAVIAKALAADMERRYPSAAEFEADLETFVAGRATAAERERLPSWDANETLEKSPETAVSRVPRLPRLSLAPLLRLIPEVNSITWAAVSGLAVGLILFVFGAYALRYWTRSEPIRTQNDYTRSTAAQVTANYQLYKKLERQNGPLGLLSPVQRLSQPLRAGLTAAADDVLDRYRLGSDPALEHFDWEKARTCLMYALELDNTDVQAKGKLGVADGYRLLLQQPATPVTLLAAVRSFEDAVSYIPRSADAHLGLARVYANGQHNIGQALAEFHAAEQLGFRPGPREFEQQADAYLYRADQELSAGRKAGADRALVLAERDFERARKLYEPIVGFSNVDRNLDRLYQDQEAEQNLAKENEQARKLAAAKKKLQQRYRRWR